MKKQDNSLSGAKRIGGLLLIVLAVVIPFLLVSGLLGLFSSDQPVPDQPDAAKSLGLIIILYIFGVLLLIFSAIAYVIFWAMDCFTFNFKAPYFKSFKVKIYLANIFIPIGFLLAISLFISAPTTPVLAQLGLPEPLPFLAPFLTTLVFGQLALSWVDIWTPVERTIVRKRAAAMGIDPIRFNQGRLIGISDPSKSCFKKLTFVEEDVGVLWIEPNQLVYIGDNDRFAFKREDIVSIEKKANPGGMAAYAGAVNPILLCRGADGVERSVRLHAWGNWTLGGLSKSQKLLSIKLESWHAGVNGGS